MTVAKIAPASPFCTLPERAYQFDAGLDVFAAQSRLILHGEIIAVRLGFKMALEPGYEAQIRPRSSIAKKGITIPNSPGTIDAGYRDEVQVLLQNTRLSKFQVNTGDKIAQMVIKKVPEVGIEIVEPEALPRSMRGTGGFGSSGDYQFWVQCSMAPSYFCIFEKCEYWSKIASICKWSLTPCEQGA